MPSVSTTSAPGHDSQRLAPEDAFYNPASRRPLTAEAALSGRKRRERPRSSSRRRKGNYKKLLWFKQPCELFGLIIAHFMPDNTVPDNYTDEETFLDHLQRNPRLQPYEFWSLMADSTVIVQHIASVAIFCCCFVAIFQNRVSPVSVVSWASFCTVLAWLLWDYWMGQEEVENNRTSATDGTPDTKEASSLSPAPASIPGSPDSAHQGPYVDPASSLSPRNQQRLATAKSALLIYAALLGLSPILKSLTRSTTSDSIWALSTWLLCMNVAFFDYSGGSGARLVTMFHIKLPFLTTSIVYLRPYLPILRSWHLPY